MFPAQADENEILDITMQQQQKPVEHGAIILLARLDSSRLPGKQLKKINENFTVLELLVHRLKRSTLNHKIILATTNRPVDNPLEDQARKLEIDIFRGDLENVAGRCLACMEQFNLDYFIRICADSPFIDPVILDQGLNTYLKNTYEITSNVYQGRDLPPGCSIEVISLNAMKRICRATNDLSYLEHVTAYAYEYDHDFSILPFRASPTIKHNALAMSVDTAEDLAKMRWVCTKLDNPIYTSIQDVISLVEAYEAL